MTTILETKTLQNSLLKSLVFIFVVRETRHRITAINIEGLKKEL